MNTAKVTAILLCAALALTACGRKSQSEATVIAVSTGQQLTDLKAAYDAGAISQKEYEEKREEILDGE